MNLLIPFLTMQNNYWKEQKILQKAIQEIEHGIVQQAEDSEECIRQMDNLSDKINSVSKNSDKIARIADDTNSIVDKGMMSIDELKEMHQEPLKLLVMLLWRLIT